MEHKSLSFKSNCSVRGLRNNNPANIRKGSPWKGLCCGYDEAMSVLGCYDGQFCQFRTIEYGIRALLYLLRVTYYRKYGLCMVKNIVSRYAPPSENATQTYVDNVCMYMNVKPSTILNLEDDNILFCLASAICMQESSYKLKYCVFENALKIL